MIAASGVFTGACAELVIRLAAEPYRIGTVYYSENHRLMPFIRSVK